MPPLTENVGWSTIDIINQRNGDEMMRQFLANNLRYAFGMPWQESDVVFQSVLVMVSFKAVEQFFDGL